MGNGFITTLSKVMGLEVRPVRHYDDAPVEADLIPAVAPVDDEPAVEAKPKKKPAPPVVNVRSFYAATIDEAMRKAEAALGPEAVILNTRATDPAFRSEGAYEVVCGLTLVPRLPKAKKTELPKPRRSPLSILPEPEEAEERPVELWAGKMRQQALEAQAARAKAEPAPVAETKPQPRAEAKLERPETKPQPRVEARQAAHLPDFVLDGEEPEPEPVLASAAPAAEGFQQEISELRRLIEALKLRLDGPIPEPETKPVVKKETVRRYGPAMMRGALIDAGLSEPWAREVTLAALRKVNEKRAAQRAAAGLEPESRENDKLSWAELRQELTERIPVPSARLAAEPAKVVIVVGAPGAGKTTALIEMAKLRRSAGESVHILAPASAAATFEKAELAGLPCDGFRTSTALLSAIQAYSEQGTVFIDTPGFGPGEMTRAGQFSRVLETVADREVHLVLPANQSNEELAGMCDRLAIFSPSRLLVTFEDQAAKFGPVYEQMLRTSKPLSYVAGEEFRTLTANGTLRLLLEDVQSADSDMEAELTVK